MAYKSERIGVRQMIEELCRAERTPREAHMELAAALEEGAIPLEFAGQLVIEEIAPIVKTLRAAAADPRHRPAGSLSARYVMILQAEDAAERQQFERACGLALDEEAPAPPSNRRFVTDEKLVAEALEGIRSGRWSNAHQAAKALASQADGASQDAIITRLRKKIRDASN
jgi:hypothetical protein